jgi:hypothetical protein
VGPSGLEPLTFALSKRSGRSGVLRDQPYFGPLSVMNLLDVLRSLPLLCCLVSAARPLLAKGGSIACAGKAGARLSGRIWMTLDVLSGATVDVLRCCAGACSERRVGASVPRAGCASCVGAVGRWQPDSSTSRPFPLYLQEFNVWPTSPYQLRFFRWVSKPQGCRP